MIALTDVAYGSLSRQVIERSCYLSCPQKGIMSLQCTETLSEVIYWAYCVLGHRAHTSPIKGHADPVEVFCTTKDIFGRIKTNGSTETRQTGRNDASAIRIMW
jgi:hypothetical protein